MTAAAASIARNIAMNVIICCCVVSVCCCYFVPDLAHDFAMVAAICRRLRTVPSYITSAGSRISSQIARSLPLDLSRQVARGVSVHARKQRNAFVRQLAIRGRFGSQVSSRRWVG